ncbi:MULTISPECIES: hypothetical protein [Alteromonas]|uniref:Uncharacterized protein n=1 Tax=Alteromonas macleodii TaxID=28108 RepID=A0A6T9XU07_ALTMA|nr:MULTISPECIES: hypothetical protein [Alteromonas]MCZ8529829.1 hypothetical protein [Alteromonas sp. PRIM-21]CAB9492133.1 conserved protein of unknown function [Alteromonas macleodii]
MARISQRAMNNVVIIAMLIMIALFNLDSLVPKKEPVQTRSLLPEDAYVLKIEHDNNSLERVGQQWRQKSLNTSLAVKPDEQFSHWQRAMLNPATEVPESVLNTQPFIVVVWLAGNSDGKVYAIYPNTSPVVIKFENNWYTLTNTDLDKLLPWTL